ncbi:uncharacterized protein GGS22DRAFT_194950 [Annulohypoxylon maeteangense]|uniref:uncharacterized protein n=1 Tax=Annulohypoxylon maeteangense TaxID=1927788 RepID=UPI00200788BB|nr:uncharacterized protein GGS22DRAFT_194950 [Annulohypoxylon maeteangense]KAI0883700.1 hypothetical protein GGS22DRAFT_194950 [Annulohypoxylon maeteangense]
MPLKNPVSAPAIRTIRTAFEELDRTITPADSRDFPDSTLQHIRKAALDIENQLAARQCLRNMRRLGPLFQGLEHYAKAVDVVCNGTPYLAWIWAPITLILRVASEYVEAFEKIIKGYSRIAESLKRFEVLGTTFSNKPDFQQTLAIYYADILQFHKHAYKFVHRSGWKLLFLTSWGRFQNRFDNIFQDLDRHGELIDKEAEAHHISDLQKLRQDIYTWKEESQDKTKQFEEEQAATKYRSIISWLNADESEQLTIFDSISAEGSKYPGTCSWALKDKKISSFLQQRPETNVLWLQGGPGTGKSVLSAQLINFMRKAKMFVISHFCTQLYPYSTTYEHVLRSMLLQLLQKDCDLVAHVYEEYVLGKKSPAIPTLERLLHDLLASISHDPRQNEYIWIVIDGVNECDAQKQASVATLINQITSRSPSSIRTTCKVLISSRVSPSMSSRLRKGQVLSLAEEKENMGLAIKHYTWQRLLTLHEKFVQLHLNSDEMKDIRDEITKKSDGMFLYARLLLDFLDNKIFYRGSEVKSSVNELPKELSDFYRKILTQILVRLDTQSADRVKSIFSWIAFARRPLKRMEFLSALSFSAGDPDIAHLAPTYILNICGTLIEERRDNTLAFIHVSVKEFLQSSSSNFVIDEREAVTEHGIATITCLLSGSNIFGSPYPKDTRYLRVARGLHGFHVYSTEYWIEYLLSHAASTYSRGPSIIFDLAEELAKKLSGLRSHLPDSKNNSVPVFEDKRLENILDPLLRKEVESALWARSLQGLESNLQTNRIAGNYVPSASIPLQDGLSSMLASYEESVKFLLAQNDYPGVSAEELDAFKSQFRGHAYTCRLASCPRATFGFESEALRLHHEMTHLPQPQCNFPGCQNPPFVSVQALRNHVKRYHVSQPARKSIRRVSDKLTNIAHKNTTISESTRVWQDQSMDETNQILNPGDISASIIQHDGMISPQPSKEERGYVERLQSRKYQLHYARTPEGEPIYEAYPEIGCVKAIRTIPKNDHYISEIYPPPPIWLQQGLGEIKQRQGAYRNGLFEGVMRYGAVNVITGMIFTDQEMPLLDTSSLHISFYFFPRICCNVCSGKLYEPDPHTSFKNFEIHLNSEDHKYNLGKGYFSNSLS